MPNDIGDLPDVNVWVALSAPAHPHHARAIKYWRQEAGKQLIFCRLTALGLVRTLTRPHTSEGPPLPLAEAWSIYRTWKLQPEVAFPLEPASVEEIMAEWIEQGILTKRDTSDLYLAAFARATSARLVTFDKRIQQLPGVKVMALE